MALGIEELLAQQLEHRRLDLVVADDEEPSAFAALHPLRPRPDRTRPADATDGVDPTMQPGGAKVIDALRPALVAARVDGASVDLHQPPVWVRPVRAQELVER